MSESFDVGDTVVLQLNVDAALEPWETTVTVTAPDGTTSTPDITKDEDGEYSASIVVTDPGRWKHRWTGESNTDGAWAVIEVRKFYVRYSTA